MRLLVIGGGPAGVSAALQGAELGASVTLVERKRVGGTSINEGPAPIRTLARAARLARDAKSWETFGLRGAAPTVDVKAAVANATRVADYSHDVKRMSDYIAAAASSWSRTPARPGSSTITPSRSRTAGGSPATPSWWRSVVMPAGCRSQGPSSP